jgi:hypothetical protein
MKYLAAALLLAAPLALAHHGWSEYDDSKPLELQGVIRSASYDNPHGMVRLDVGGKTWTVVLAPPGRMASRGLDQKALVPGVDAIVNGYPNRSKPDEMRAERITIGGKTTELR